MNPGRPADRTHHYRSPASRSGRRRSTTGASPDPFGGGVEKSSKFWRPAFPRVHAGVVGPDLAGAIVQLAQSLDLGLVAPGAVLLFLICTARRRRRRPRRTTGRRAFLNSVSPPHFFELDRDACRRQRLDVILNGINNSRHLRRDGPADPVVAETCGIFRTRRPGPVFLAVSGPSTPNTSTRSSLSQPFDITSRASISTSRRGFVDRRVSNDELPSRQPLVELSMEALVVAKSRVVPHF